MIIAAIWLCGKFYIEEEWAPSDMELIALTEHPPTQSEIRQAEKDILQTLKTRLPKQTIFRPRVRWNCDVTTLSNWG